MTSDQTGPQTGDQQRESGGEVALLLQAEDGATYLVPMAALEPYRLSDEQRTEMTAHLAAAGSEVQGYDYTAANGQFIGHFQPLMAAHAPAGQFSWAPVIGLPYRMGATGDYHPLVR